MWIYIVGIYTGGVIYIVLLYTVCCYIYYAVIYSMLLYIFCCYIYCVVMYIMVLHILLYIL